MKENLILGCVLSIMVCGCEPLLENDPDLSKHSYSGTVLDAISKVPVSGLPISIYYDHWVPGDYTTLYLPYRVRKYVDATETDSNGKFNLFDSGNDDRATNISFATANYLGAEFKLDERISGDYKIELFPIGTIGIIQTMPYLLSNEIIYTYTSKGPVLYTAYNTKSLYTNEGYQSGQTYVRGVTLLGLPSCEYELKAKFGIYSGIATVSIIPFDTVYYKLELLGNELNFKKTDPANLVMPFSTIKAIENYYSGALVKYEVTTTDENSSYIFSHGIVWGTKEHPTIDSNDGIHNSTDYGNIFECMTSYLQCGMTYYFRPFIRTINGVIYGNEETLPIRCTKD